MKIATRFVSFFSFLALWLTLILPTPVQSQTNPLDRKISIQRHGITLAEAFDEIGNAANCTFSYSNSLMDLRRRINLNYVDARVADILTDLLGDDIKATRVQGNQILIQSSLGKGTVSGTVNTSDGQPAGFVTVSIRGQRSTQADDQGRFILGDIESGTYTITASYVGLKTQQQRVTVTTDGTTKVFFTLSEDAQTLQEVVVNGQRMNRLVKKETEYAARMPLDNLQNPQVYHVVGEELVANQLLTNIPDLLRFIPAVSNAAGYHPGYPPGVWTRGFYSEINYRNGKRHYSVGGNEIGNVERIEVLKGPSGSLFPESSYGGVINQITKKPHPEFGGNIQLITGSYDYNRLAADINTPLNKEGSLLARFNGAYSNENSFQDFGHAKAISVAPSIAYQVNGNLLLNVDAEIYDFQGVDLAGLFAFEGSGIDNMAQLDPYYNLSFSTDEIVSKKRNEVFSIEAVYRLSEQWTSTSSYTNSRSRSNNRNLYIDLYEGPLVERSLSKWYANSSYSNIQQLFNGDFSIGHTRNRTLVGFDYLRYRNKGSSSALWGYDSFDYTTQRAPYISVEEYEAAIATVTPSASLASNQRTSVYLSNVLDITSRIYLLTSLAYTYFDSFVPDGETPNLRDETNSYRDDAWAPKVGLVYQLVKDKVSLFGNYMSSTGFVNSYRVDDGTGNPVAVKAKPIYSSQWEGGIKSALWQDKLAITASYYDLRVENLVVTDPSNQQFQIQDGLRKHSGVEVEVIANPTRGFDVMAGYGYVDTEYLEGERKGTKPMGVANHVFNYNVGYTLQQGLLMGLSLSVNGNYQSESFHNNTLTIVPGFHKINGVISFAINKVRMGINVNNITNRITWATNGYAQPKRHLRGSIVYQF